jgi:hypothetical protein
MGCACVSVWPDKYLCSLVQSKMSGLMLLSSRDDEAFVSICLLVLLAKFMYLLVGRFVCRLICHQICLCSLCC